MGVVETLVEVKLPDEDAFLKIKETLSRIGVASNKNKTLYQSVGILHKQGKYYLVHFKQMFELDGKASDFNDDDLGRLNTICNLLQDWGLVTVVDPKKIKSPRAKMSTIKVIPFKEKEKWNLVEKYSIGKK